MAIAAVIFTVVAPAVALTTYFRHTLDFSASEPAPLVVMKQFAELFATNAPPAMSPKVIPLATRKVAEQRVNGRRTILWVAPTRRGGFCWLFTDIGGGCQTTRESTGGVAASGEMKPWLLPISVGNRTSANGNTLITLTGVLLDERTTQVEIEYSDGSSSPIRATWVSEPIDAGFFAIGEADGPQGARPVAVEALDAEGRTLARVQLLART